MKRFLALFIAACFSSPAFAFEGYNFWSDEGGFFFATPEAAPPPGMSLVRLVTLTSDQDNNRHYLHAMVDKSRNMTGIFNEADKGNRDNNGREGTGKPVIWLNEIESRDGAVMYTARGRNILIMQGQLDRSTQEGRFSIRYLANGLFGRYESCDLLLRKSGSGWFVQNAYTGATVNTVKIITHSLGVRTLQGICP